MIRESLITYIHVVGGLPGILSTALDEVDETLIREIQLRFFQTMKRLIRNINYYQSSLYNTEYRNYRKCSI